MCSCKTSYMQGGRVVTSGVALIRRATFSSFRTTKFFTMLFFARVWGVFWYVKKSVCCEKSHLWFYHKWSKSLEILCINGRMRIHIRTPRNTTLHHPSTHSDTDTDQKKTQITAFPYTSGSVSQVFASSFAHQWMRPIESLLVNKGMGRGSSWLSLDLETLESADQHDCRGAQNAPLAGGRWSSVRLSSSVRSENFSRISVKMVSNCFTLSRTFNRFAEVMLARLALGSGRRISSTSLASATRKSSELTLWLQVAVFTHFIREQWGDVTTRPSPFSRYTMQKGGRVVTSAKF